MISLSAPDFAENQPFPHCGWDQVLPVSEADAVLDWLERAPWQLRVESFYEQHEFSLLSNSLPTEMAALTSPDTTGGLANYLKDLFEVDSPLTLVDVSAHRLSAGQTIRVHNDFLGTEETHRLLIQLNRGWTINNGGLLMVFGSDSAEDVRDAMLPNHGSGFAFEISSNSFHAVSTINSGERYTLVYTFRSNVA